MTEQAVKSTRAIIEEIHEGTQVAWDDLTSATPFDKSEYGRNIFDTFSDFRKAAFSLDNRSQLSDCTKSVPLR